MAKMNVEENLATLASCAPGRCASIRMNVEENLATPESFQFCCDSLVTVDELPSADRCWPDIVPCNRLIQVEQGVKFGFQWCVKGCLVDIIKCTKWKIQLFFERWGCKEHCGDPEPKCVNFVAESGYLYTEYIELPPNTIPEGVYEIVGVLRLYDFRGNPLPVAGFAELGKFEFYEASAPVLRG